MRNKIDFQALLDLIKVNEVHPNFDLYEIFHPCGTYGCAVGNWMICRPKEDYNKTHTNLPFYDYLSHRFGISNNEAQYLFGEYKEEKENWRTYYNVYNWMWEDKVANHRRPNDKETVLNRIRKFVYYHLRKREFCLDERGVKQSAREAGHVNFSKQIKKALIPA